MDEAPSWRETLARATLASYPMVGGAAQVLYEDQRARQAAKMGRTIQSIIEITGEPALAAALDRDPYVEALFVNAVDAAMRTALEAKRALLAKAAADPVIDIAKLDESYLIVAALSVLDVPHVRALKALAEEWDDVQKHPTDLARWGRSKVWGSLPAPIRAGLERTGAARAERTTAHRDEPNRQDGITDFGLELIAKLIDEGAVPGEGEA
jgi:hypothetical protein